MLSLGRDGFLGFSLLSEGLLQLAFIIEAAYLRRSIIPMGYVANRRSISFCRAIC